VVAPDLDALRHHDLDAHRRETVRQVADPIAARMPRPLATRDAVVLVLRRDAGEHGRALNLVVVGDAAAELIPELGLLVGDRPHAGRQAAEAASECRLGPLPGGAPNRYPSPLPGE
jgi:hypothetical protein